MHAASILETGGRQRDLWGRLREPSPAYGNKTLWPQDPGPRHLKANLNSRTSPLCGFFRSGQL